MEPRTLLLFYAELLEKADEIFTVGHRFHLLVNVQNPAVFANDKCPSFWHLSAFMDDAVCFRNFLSWIAENRIVEFQFFCKSGVLFDRVTAGGEVGHVVAANRIAVLTERQALFGSATGKGFREPCDHHGLFALEL